MKIQTQRNATASVRGINETKGRLKKLNRAMDKKSAGNTFCDP